MKHAVLFVGTVLIGIAAYYFGLGGLLAGIAAALVCGLLAAVLALMLIAAGASQSEARRVAQEQHESEVGL